MCLNVLHKDEQGGVQGLELSFLPGAAVLQIVDKINLQGSLKT